MAQCGSDSTTQNAANNHLSTLPIMAMRMSTLLASGGLSTSAAASTPSPPAAAAAVVVVGIGGGGAAAWANGSPPLPPPPSRTYFCPPADAAACPRNRSSPPADVSTACGRGGRGQGEMLDRGAGHVLVSIGRSQSTRVHGLGLGGGLVRAASCQPGEREYHIACFFCFYAEVNKNKYNDGSQKPDRMSR